MSVNQSTKNPLQVSGGRTMISHVRPGGVHHFERQAPLIRRVVVSGAALLASIFFVIACSSDQGPGGPQGPQGEPGAAGQQVLQPRRAPEVRRGPRGPKAHEGQPPALRC